MGNVFPAGWVVKNWIGKCEIFANKSFRYILYRKDWLVLCGRACVWPTTVTMSTQSYYKERLGFDQTEWNDGISTPIYEANLTKSKGLWQCFIEATSGTSVIFCGFPTCAAFKLKVQSGRCSKQDGQHRTGL